MFERIRRIIELAGLPRDWTSIRATTVVVPLNQPDAKVAAKGLRQALKLRDAAVAICQDVKWDDVFQAIDAKRRAKMPLSDEELKYMRQADINYLEMVVWKIDIAVFYQGDYLGLPEHHRRALKEVVAGHVGCSLVSNPQTLAARRIVRIDPEAEISAEHARKVVKKLLRSG